MVTLTAMTAHTLLNIIYRGGEELDEGPRLPGWLLRPVGMWVIGISRITKPSARGRTHLYPPLFVGSLGAEFYILKSFLTKSSITEGMIEAFGCLVFLYLASDLVAANRNLGSCPLCAMDLHEE
jgi:hypothetical protein